MKNWFTNNTDEQTIVINKTNQNISQIGCGNLIKMTIKNKKEKNKNYQLKINIQKKELRLDKKEKNIKKLAFEHSRGTRGLDNDYKYSFFPDLSYDEAIVKNDGNIFNQYQLIMLDLLP